VTNRSYSYSQIQAAYKCLRYYKLLYVDKLKPEVPHSADMSFGTAIHAAIQACLEGDDGQAVFSAYWESEKDSELKYGRFDWETLAKQGPEIMRKFEKSHAKKFKIHKMEERIYSEIEGVRLEGTPDFLGEFAGVPSVVDFKVMSYPIPEERLVCNDQMPLYYYMAKKEQVYEAEQLVYFPIIKGKYGQAPSIQTPLILPVKSIDIDATLSNILNVCRELDARTEFQQNRSSCIIGENRCDFWDVCHGRKK
jgi:hypothetical protein